jgi:tetratricopeptide (TPR) repeat protein
MKLLAAALLLSLSAPAAPAAKGKASAEKATAAARAQAAAHRERGLAAVKAGRDDEAVAEFAQAAALDPEDQVSTHEWGKLLFKQGRLPAAIVRFQAAVKLGPADALAWFDLAYACRRAQRFPEAVVAYQKNIDLRPDEPDGYYGLAESQRQMGHAKEAIAAYELYIKKETRSTEQKWVDRSRERIAELRQGLAAGPAPAPAASPAPPVAAAKVPVPAAPALTAPALTAPPAAASGTPSTPPAPHAVAATSSPPSTPAAASPAPAASSGATRTIVHGADERPATGPVVAPQKPENGPAAVPAGPPPAVVAKARLADGDRAFEAKDFHAALFAYQDAVMAEPGNAHARVRAGRAYARLGYAEEAAEQWNLALAADPKNAEAPQLLAAAGARKADPAPASPAPLSQPGLPVVVAPPSQDEEGARRHYATGAALVREAEAVGNQEAQAKKYLDALAELNKAVSLHPGYANALIARGSARVGLGQLREAVEDYWAAQAADPSLAAPLFGLAEAYRSLGEGERAAQMYRAFAGSNAPDAQAALKAYALKSAEALQQK